MLTTRATAAAMARQGTDEVPFKFCACCPVEVEVQSWLSGTVAEQATQLLEVSRVWSVYRCVPCFVHDFAARKLDDSLLVHASLFAGGRHTAVSCICQLMYLAHHVCTLHR